MYLTNTLSLVFVALVSIASASPENQPGSYPGKTPDGLIWKRYEPNMVPPPPPHPAEMEPRSIHRSRPSRYHSTFSDSRTSDSPPNDPKRRLMNYKQVTVNQVKKRQLEKKKKQQGKSSTGNHEKKVYFEVKRELSVVEEEEAATKQLEKVVEGWSWVDDDELIAVKTDDSLSWAQKMERRMRKTKPLFSNTN